MWHLHDPKSIDEPIARFLNIIITFSIASIASTNLLDYIAINPKVSLIFMSTIPVRSEPSESSSSSDDSDGSSSFISSPKRRYLIAPRVGRASLWPAPGQSAFEGSVDPSAAAAELASVNAPRSLLLLINGNANPSMRRVRSIGLMPQARIGRRAAPMSGLMPMPRVGRSSGGAGLVEQQTALTPEEAEVALSSLNDAGPLGPEAFGIYGWTSLSSP